MNDKDPARAQIIRTHVDKRARGERAASERWRSDSSLWERLHASTWLQLAISKVLFQGSCSTGTAISTHGSETFPVILSIGLGLRFVVSVARNE